MRSRYKALIGLLIIGCSFSPFSQVAPAANVKTAINRAETPDKAKENQVLAYFSAQIPWG